MYIFNEEKGEVSKIPIVTLFHKVRTDSVELLISKN